MRNVSLARLDGDGESERVKLALAFSNPFVVRRRLTVSSVDSAGAGGPAPSVSPVNAPYDTHTLVEGALTFSAALPMKHTLPEIGFINCGMTTSGDGAPGSCENSRVVTRIAVLTAGVRGTANPSREPVRLVRLNGAPALELEVGFSGNLKRPISWPWASKNTSA
jgi:hypothetical protein